VNLGWFNKSKAYLAAFNSLLYSATVAFQTSVAKAKSSFSAYNYPFKVSKSACNSSIKSRVYSILAKEINIYYLY
jgi:hypothetical protein